MKGRGRFECDGWGKEARYLVGVEALILVWVVGRRGGTVNTKRWRGGGEGGGKDVGGRGKEAGLLGAEKIVFHLDDGEFGTLGDPASDDRGEGGRLEGVEKVPF